MNSIPAVQAATLSPAHSTQSCDIPAQPEVLPWGKKGVRYTIADGEVLFAAKDKLQVGRARLGSALTPAARAVLL